MYFFFSLLGTTNTPPLEYSIDNVNFQLASVFVVPNNEKKKYTVHVRDAEEKKQAIYFTDECGIEVNDNNFIRWKNYEGLWIDNGQVIPAECPGVVLGNNTPLEVIQHCIVLD